MTINLSGKRILVAATWHPFGNYLPDTIVGGLTAELREREVEVELMIVPFHNSSEDSIIRSVTAWNLFDFGTTDKNRYDFVICTSFPSYLIRHPRKIVWMTSDFSSTLDHYGKSDPPFQASFVNETNRMLVNRLTQHALQTACFVSFATPSMSERTDHYLNIEGPVLVPVPRQFNDKLNDVSSERILLIADKEVFPLFFEFIKSVPEQSELKAIICSERSVKLDVQGLIEAGGFGSNVSIVTAYESERWDQLLKTVSLVIDFRVVGDFNPIVIEAAQFQLPLCVHKRAGWSRTIIEQSRAGIIFDDSLDQLKPIVRKESEDSQNVVNCGKNWSSFFESDWDTIINTLFRAK